MNRGDVDSERHDSARAGAYTFAIVKARYGLRNQNVLYLIWRKNRKKCGGCW